MNLNNMNFKNNETKLVGLLTILVLLWIVLYFIPELFVSLFHTLLGNLILLIITIITVMHDRVKGLLLGVVFILLYRFSLLSTRETGTLKESFTPKSELDFLKIQHTINRQKVFDMEVMNKQTTQEELDYFNTNGYWPWSKETIEKYIASLEKNPYVRTVPKDAVNYARSIYNETAILQLLYLQSNEGLFLINGVEIHDYKDKDTGDSHLDYIYKAGIANDNRNDVIKCNLDNDEDPKLERIKYADISYFEKSRTPVDYMNLEQLIPGFKFLGEKCNPCKNLSSYNDKCQFSLELPNKNYF